MIKTLNDLVAIKPLIFDHDKGEKKEMVKGFVGSDKLMKTIITSEVIFQSKSFKTGEKVFLRADAYQLPYVKNILNIDGTEFVLVPESIIIAVVA
jgi:hypothetical protein